MDLFAIHSQTLDQHQTELGDHCPVFKWAGKEYAIVPGSVSFNKPLREGGFDQIYDFSFTCTVAQFMDPPDLATAEVLKEKMLNTHLVYRNESYRVANVIVAPGGAQISVQLVAA